MNIDLFSIKSIEKALKEINNIKSKMEKMNKFLTLCCQSIVDMANNYLEREPFDDELKQEIMDSWHINIVGDTAFITNEHEKSVYVEFGTGIIGASSPHPNANEVGYEYNIKTRSKSIDGTWKFDYKDVLDIKEGRYTTYESSRPGVGTRIKTRGQEATMFLFNALLDFATSNKIKEIWDKL